MSEPCPNDTNGDGDCPRCAGKPERCKVAHAVMPLDSLPFRGKVSEPDGIGTWVFHSEADLDAWVAEDPEKRWCADRP